MIKTSSTPDRFEERVIKNNYKIKYIIFILLVLSFQNTFATTYSSSTVTQVTTPTSAGATNQEILRIAVVGGGGGSMFPLCSMSFAMNNSVVPLNAKLYYTGTIGTFAATTLLGTIANPTGTITFSLTQTHGAGTFYYWLVYDIPSDAPNCSSFDASVSDNGISFSGAGGSCPGTTTATPISSNPAGDRQIEVPGCWKYCAAGGTSSAAGYLSNVTLNTINNNSTYDGYTNTGLTTTLLTGYTYTLNVSKITTNNTYTQAWIDWNNDGDFLDTGEIVLPSANSSTSGTRTISVTVPLTATIGITRMRVMFKFSTAITAGGCDTNLYNDAEDYYINILEPAPCVSYLQPFNLFLTAGNTFINGAFSYPTPQAESYLVVISNSAVAPTPINGTTYSIGSTLSPGYTVVDNDGNNSFTASGLTPLTNYYFYIFSYDTNCIGGPLYTTTDPLTDSVSTNNSISPVYCTPTSSNGIYINLIEGVGAFANEKNGPTGYTVPGYTNYSNINIATQVSGGGVNINISLAGTSSFGPPPCTSSSQLIGAFVDWNKDGDFTDASEKVYESTAGTGGQNIFGFVIPSGTPAGIYRLRIRTKSLCLGAGIDPCTNYGGGETEDYSISIIENCSAQITSIVDGNICGLGNAVTLTAYGTPGTTEYRWYTTPFGGTQVGSSATNTWTTPTLSNTQTFYVTAFNGSCESLYRTAVQAYVFDTTDINFTPNNPTACGEDIIAVTAYASQNIQNLFYEGFNSGNYGQMILSTPLNLWDTNGNGITNSGDFPEPRAPWLIQSSPWIPNGTSVFVPAISSGNVGNYYAVTVSDYIGQNIDTRLTTPALNSTGYSTLTLSFRQYYSDFNNTDFAYVEVSTNGGVSWSSLATYTKDMGNPGVFSEESINLNAYINVADLRVRFRYSSGWCDGWAIDDIRIYGLKPFVSSYTWSGTGINAYYQLPTIPANIYSGQSIETIYFLPDVAQMETTDWTFDVTATLPGGCVAQVPITVDNKSKTWKGTTNNDWYTATNWAPNGVPDANSCVYIYDGPNDSYINISAQDAYARFVTVRPNGQLQIEPDNTLTVTDAVTVDAGGTFNIENSGSLIQVNNVANTGNILMKRNVNVRKLDYVYWSSPVANFGLSNISTTSYRYKWIPTIAGNVNGYGNWTTANETMVLGKGYIVRGPNSYTTTLQNYTANFTGVPNNGIINMPISRGVYDGANYATGVSTTLATRDDDNWNLIGNPYPSAVNANTFLATNTNIAGFIKYWTHGTTPSTAISDPFYNNYAQNYTVADYVTYNATGANPALGSGNIAAGQGFFVLMNHTSAATTENVVFNNSMRRNDYRNDLFFRTTDSAAGDENEEKHRIWLNLISPSSTSSTTLLGYVTGATNSIDRMYDAPALGVKTNFELYSIENVDKLNIQGRALPFNNEDRIPLGVTISQNGIHTIGISTVDGLFESADQAIFLEDNLLGITHDLRSAPYSFTATIGTNENRFVLKFNNETLGSDDFNSDSVTVFTNDFININAANQTIKSVKVFDLLGKVIGNFNNVDATTFTSKNIAKTQTALLVEVTLENGNTKTYKVIY